MEAQVATIPMTLARRRRRWLSDRALLAYWMIAGAALFFAVGSPPVQRTQEARVLETARQMLGGGWRAWMVPMLNGKPRLRKPPLSYWMTAAAYEIGGVSEGVGRTPTVVLGWLTLGVTFWCGQWLFGRRAAFFAAACLLCSYLFFRFVRSAETDTPAMLFVTVGTYAFWRAFGGEGNEAAMGGRTDAEIPPPNSNFSFPPSPPHRVPASSPPSAAWFHLGAAATALAILSKGPPGVYPPLFLLVLCVTRRRWEVWRRLLRSGALLTLLVIAVPWFLYVFHGPGLEQWRKESDELLGGEDHRGHFWQYFYEILIAAAPWCLLVPPALYQAGVLAWRGSARLWGMLLWLVVIFVPLCLLGNKQIHYLLPLMPPLMILVGWWIDLAIGPADRPARSVPLLDITLGLTLLGVPAVLLSARHMLGYIGPGDRLLAGTIAGAVVLVLAVRLWGGQLPALLAYLVAVLCVLAPATGLWMPRFEQDESRNFAKLMARQFGHGPFCFYGLNYSLPLCFNLRTPIPQVLTPGELEKLARQQPRVFVIAQTKSRFVPPPIPPEFHFVTRISRPGQTVDIYQQPAASDKFGRKG